MIDYTNGKAYGNQYRYLLVSFKGPKGKETFEFYSPFTVSTSTINNVDNPLKFYVSLLSLIKICNDLSIT